MANKGSIQRKWYVIDAAGKPMGKTAVIAADLLRGKRKPELFRVFFGIMPLTASCMANSGLVCIRVRYLVSFRPPTQPETRLHIYRGSEHSHAAQKPEIWATTSAGCCPCWP